MRVGRAIALGLLISVAVNAGACAVATVAEPLSSVILGPGMLFVKILNAIAGFCNDRADAIAVAVLTNFGLIWGLASLGLACSGDKKGAGGIMARELFGPRQKEKEASKDANSR
jgi:hypothetical protein